MADCSYRYDVCKASDKYLLAHPFQGQRRPKVDEFYRGVAALGVEDDVLRLQVAVQDATRM